MAKFIYQQTPGNDSGQKGLAYKIGEILGFLFYRILLPLLIIVATFLWAPGLVGLSWVGLACAIGAVLVSVVGLFPISIVLMIVYAAISLSFFPYWVILVYQKLKGCISWKDVWVFYGAWFLKGPFAYRNLLEKLRENQSMPRTEKTIGKVVEWWDNRKKSK